MCVCSLPSRLNGYMYSNGTSLNLALFILISIHFICRITLQLLVVKIIPCRVASLIDIQPKASLVCLIKVVIINNLGQRQKSA